MANVNPAYWIARIMITWSIVTGCMAAISQPWHFYLLRFLLVKITNINVAFGSDGN